MAASYDVIVIGSGLGGLTAAALLSRRGRKVLVVERNHSLGGAASTYKVGDLTVEASLHETTDPRHPLDPKHHILAELGLLGALDWVETGSLYEVRGGPVGAPFVLPDNFAAAKNALLERFPRSRDGLGSLLGEMEQISAALGQLSKGRAAFARPMEGFKALASLRPVVSGWRLSLGARLATALDDEAAKCALAANLPYYHDDPDTLWWIMFAVAQGGYLTGGGRYIRGGSSRLSHALARIVRECGGEVLLGRSAVQVLLDERGRAKGIAHTTLEHGDRQEAYASNVIANAAPDAVAGMLSDRARISFSESYARLQPSISLFSLTLGLSEPPISFGLTSYSTVLLPPWMSSLGDFRRSAGLLSLAPSEYMPPLVVVNYSAIDSGLGGPPYPVSITGVDRLQNWSGLDSAAYDAKRGLWREAITNVVDAQFQGFKSAITTSVFSTARSMHTYLNQPQGAVYGFAPTPPARGIWHGPGRSPTSAIPGLFLGSSYSGSGGFTGAMLAGAAAAAAANAKAL